jgi:hypothetical protein
MVSVDQLNRELAAARPPSPPPDHAAAAAWHQDNGLPMPDHLATEPGLTTLEAGSLPETAPATLAGPSQPDPRPRPDPYTDVTMGDVEDIVDYELDS